MNSLIKNAQSKNKTLLNRARRTFIPRDDDSEDLMIAEVNGLVSKDALVQEVDRKQLVYEKLSECEICIPGQMSFAEACPNATADDEDTESLSTAYLHADDKTLVGDERVDVEQAQVVTPKLAKAKPAELDKKTSKAKTVDQKRVAHERAVQAFTREIESIKLQLAVGLDPNVSIASMSFITNRSRATLYREFGRTLPAPIKVGNSSYQKYSVVQAYASGRLNVKVEQAEQPETQTKNIIGIQ